MAKRKIEQVTIAPTSGTPAEQDTPKPPKTLNIRMSADDQRFLEALQRDTGIMNASDVIRHLLRITVKERNLKL